MPDVRKQVSTGISGLDEILNGGLPAGRIHLVHGDAGTGKTTLGFQFLRAAAASGRRALCITLLQTLDELEQISASHGWDLAGVDLVELPAEVRSAALTEQTVFSPANVELSEVSEAIEAAIRRYNPDCLFIDSLSELYLLVDTGYQLRRQLLRLKQELDGMDCTTILSAGPAGDVDTSALETLVHGVIGLDIAAPDFGRPHRRVIVSKMRAMEFRAGYHDAIIVTGGLQVFPRVMARGVPASRPAVTVQSGTPELDALLGGGMDMGTTCVISGTSGAGKSSLASLYLCAAASQGVKSSILCFDERRETVLRRAEGLGLPLVSRVEDGTVAIEQISAGDISPGQFADRIRRSVESDGVRVVVIDSVSGFLQAMPGERTLVTQLHELLGYLCDSGVLTLMVVATHGLFGESDPGVDLSYIADTVILLRHFEALGEVRRCIAVLKKRYGDHERTIREVSLGADGICVGAPLTSFEGLLSGRPRYLGEEGRLFSLGRSVTEGGA